MSSNNEENNKKITIRLKTLDGNISSLEIDETIKIEELKKIISQKNNNIDINRIRLIYKGKQLKNEEKLNDHVNKNDEIIHLMFKTVEQANANDTIVNDGHRQMTNNNNNLVNLIGGIINNAFNNNNSNNNNNNGLINSQVNIVNASSNPNAGVNLANNFNGENLNAFNLGTNFNIIDLNNPENLNNLRQEIQSGNAQGFMEIIDNNNNTLTVGNFMNFNNDNNNNNSNNNNNNDNNRNNNITNNNANNNLHSNSSNTNNNINTITSSNNNTNDVTNQNQVPPSSNISHNNSNSNNNSQHQNPISLELFNSTSPFPITVSPIDRKYEKFIENINKSIHITSSLFNNNSNNSNLTTLSLPLLPTTQNVLTAISRTLRNFIYTFQNIIPYLMRLSELFEREQYITNLEDRKKANELLNK